MLARDLENQLYTFHILGKDFPFKQWNFAKIGDSSGLIFLRMTIGMLSRPVTFLGSRLLINLEISRAVINTIEIMLSETVEVGKWMSNVF